MFKIKCNKNLRFNFKENTLICDSNIADEIKLDKQLWYAFQANIAIQFQDHYRHYKRITNKKYLNSQDIHKISNDAAHTFLNIWTSMHNNDL